jgi:hypothetical protein
MWIKKNVVMLPTNEKAIIYTDRHGNLKLHSTESKLPIDSIGSNQHLYITSDDEIKKNDWAYDIDLKRIFQAHKNLNLSHYKHVFKKVIATTDSSIGIKKVWKQTNKKTKPYNIQANIETTKLIDIFLPQLSQSFITKYIEEYNKGNIITEVMVEYETITKRYGSCSKGEGVTMNIEQLKINPKDNTITIRKVEDSWSREEVIDLLYKHTEFMLSGNKITLDKWIEENL